MYSGTQILSSVAKALSAILHPALMPVWLMSVLMSRGILLPGAQVQAKSWFMLAIVLNTVAVPGVCAFLFDRLSFGRENPKATLRRRILPMAVMLLSYAACLVMIRDVPMAYPVGKMLRAGIGCLLFGTGSAFFMKASMHMVAQGAAVAYLGVAVQSGAGGMTLLLYGSIALAALLSSARLYLDAEDAGQAAAGFGGGFVVTLLVALLM